MSPTNLLETTWINWTIVTCELGEKVKHGSSSCSHSASNPPTLSCCGSPSLLSLQVLLPIYHRLIKTFSLLQVELLADRLRECRASHSPPRSMDGEGGAAHYTHLQVSLLLIWRWPHNRSTALPKDPITGGRVPFLGRCSLAKMSGRYISFGL